MKPWRLALVALLLVLPSGAGGQAVGLAALRARAAASPEDPRAACELAFALVTAALPEEAVATAGPAIARLRAQTGRAAARTLGACLYNRGRAHEALGAHAAAVTDYADSLDRRPNDAVWQRLRGLVPDLPDVPALAAVAATVEDFAFGPESSVTRARASDGSSWLLVTSGRGEYPSVVAVTRACGEPRAEQIDQGWFDNYGSLRVERAMARRLGALDALVVEIGGAGDATCHRMDGVMDSVHTATAIVSLSACEVRAQTFVTRRLVCHDEDDGGPHGHGYRVRLDPAGSVVTTRVPGRFAPDSEIGRFPITGASP